MPDFHNASKFPASCSDDIENTRTPNPCCTSLNETDAGFPFPSNSDSSNSLDFAENLISRSRERFHNPTQSLQLLSCGVEALKKRASLASVVVCYLHWNIINFLALQLSTCLKGGQFDSERPISEKKIPEEHSADDFITGSEDQCTSCCNDGEGDTKGDKSSGKGTQTCSNAPTVDNNTMSKVGSVFLAQKSSGNGDDDGDDDDDRRRRKFTKTPCSGSDPEPINDDDDKDGSDDGYDDESSNDDNDDDSSDSDAQNGKKKSTMENDELVSNSCHQVPECMSLTEVVDGIEGNQGTPPEITDDKESADGNKEEEEGPANNDGNMLDGSADDDGDNHNAQMDKDPDYNAIEDHASQPFNYSDTATACAKKPEQTLAEEERLLQEAFTCYTETHLVIEKCRESPCYQIHKLLMHSRECKYRVLGGCGQCINLRDLYVYHVRRCDGTRCAISRCREIKSHLRQEGVGIFDSWRYQNDKVFFGESFEAESSMEFVPITYISMPYNHADASCVSSQSMGITQDEIDELIREVSLQNSFTPHSIDPWPPDENSRQYSNISNVARGVQSIPDLKSTSTSCISLERSDTVTVLHPFDENNLSVHNGRYDEGFEWMRVHEDKGYLGQGSFGKCYLNTDLKTSKLFATKKIPLNKYDDNELSVWSTISGCNVRCLDLFGAVKVEQTVIIFMEYMEGGSIAQLLCHQEKECFDENSSKYVLREVLEGLDFLHSMCIIHRDVKGANVFVNHTLTKVKIGDYGSAVQLTSMDHMHLGQLSGTEYFMAPEACRSEQISFSVDIWSCACLMVQMLTGEPPFFRFTGSILYKVGSLEGPPPLPECCSDEAREMLTDMFAVKPSERPTAQDLLAYPLLSEANCPTQIQLPPDDEGIQCGVDDDYHTPLSVPQGNSLVEHGELSMIHVDKELHQLQSDFILSISLEGANVSDYIRMVSQSDNAESFSDEEELAEDSSQFYHGEEEMPSLASSSSYSIKDLTKVEFYNNVGELLLEVREKSSCTISKLAEKLHGQIKDKDINLECFSVQLSGDAMVDVNQNIGRTILSLYLQPAAEEDWYTKWTWRVNSHGIIERIDHDST